MLPSGSFEAPHNTCPAKFTVLSSHHRASPPCSCTKFGSRSQQPPCPLVVLPLTVNLLPLGPPGFLATPPSPPLRGSTFLTERQSTPRRALGNKKLAVCER